MENRIVPSFFLILQLALRRVEWTLLAALLFCAIGASLQWLVLPELGKRTDAITRSPIDTPYSRSEDLAEAHRIERYQAFIKRMAVGENRTELLKTVFSEAGAAGIALSQGEYTLVPDGDGGFDKLQINLPVKGSYGQIRSFAKSLLHKIPSLSLDEIYFKRENINNTTVEAKLRLTIYLSSAR